MASSDMSDIDDAEYSGSESSYSFESGSDDAKSGDGMDDDRPRAVTRATLKAMYDSAVSNVADLTGLSPDLAGVLLVHVNFNRDVTNTDWFDPGKATRLKAEAGLESCCAAGTAPDPDVPFSCEACLEDVDIGETYAMGCEHRFCKSCWVDHIQPEQRTSLLARCPNGDCKLAVGLSTAEAVMAPAEYDKFLGWVLDRFAEHTQHLKRCPTPGCEVIIQNRDRGSFPEVVCPGCTKRWCFSCREEPHRPANCEQVAAWNQKAGVTDLTALWIKANTKKCPKCGNTINKDAGCQHMTCDRCRHQFCWLCMRPYSEHSEKTGGFYACHQFEQRIKSEGKTEEEKESLQAQRTLRNYNMAVERHLSHKQSYESVETDLLEYANRNTDRLAAGGFAPGSFLSDAVATIAQCRRVLCWSYVYKYYKFADEGSERELRLFEDYQGRLEQLTHHLQDQVARDVVEFLPPPPSRAASGAGAGVGAGGSSEERASKFDVFRSEVQRYAAAVKRFLSSVLDFEVSSRDFQAVEWVARAVDPATGMRPVWQWKHPRRGWVNYPDSIAKGFEESLSIGKTVMEVEVSGDRCKVDLVAHSHLNMDTQTSSVVRRVLEKGGDWSCDSCTYHNTAGASTCAVCDAPRGSSRAAAGR